MDELTPDQRLLVQLTLKLMEELGISAISVPCSEMTSVSGSLAVTIDRENSAVRFVAFSPEQTRILDILHTANTNGDQADYN